MKVKKIHVGQYKLANYCRFCKSKNIYNFLDLGNQPLAGGFLKKTDFKEEKFYPLALFFCRDCYLVQTTATVDRNKLFKNYFYHSSAITTLSKHFTKNARILSEYFINLKKPSVLEIGCNDSNFLTEMAARKFKVLGIDPAENIIKPLQKKKLPIINAFFSKKKAMQILRKYGKISLIVSTNTLAHIENMHDVVEGIKLLLEDDGFLYFENHYLGNLVKENQYDMIYHEHLYYYSIISLINFFKQHGMEIFNIRRVPIHGGSLGYFVQKYDGKHRVSSNVDNLTRLEKKQGINKINYYKRFANKVSKQKNELASLLKKLKNEKRLIVGYGASGRGTVVSNYCNIDKKILDYVIDDSIAKQSFFTPGNHLEIRPSSLNNINRPDYTLLFAWTFFKEITNRNKKYTKTGGKFIIPLPKVRIIK